MQLSLDACLQAADATQTLLAFAKKDLSEENLEFWLEVQAFRKRWDSGSDEQRNKDAEWMVAEFLTEGSPRQARAATRLSAICPPAMHPPATCAHRPTATQQRCDQRVAQVCIGDTRVKEVLDNAAGNYTRDMFALPEDIAYGTLKMDIFPRFEESEQGKRFFDTRDDLVEPIPRRGSTTGSSHTAPSS